MSNRKLSVVILAAGKGTRMHSSLPKALYPVGGKTMVQRVIDTAIDLNASRIHVVYGPDGEEIPKKCSSQNVPLNWVKQDKPLGTGDAVRQVLPLLLDHEDVMILYSDVPLISLDTLHRLLLAKPKEGIGLVTATLKNPDGYGRIIREQGEVVSIIEQKDSTKQQQRINEISTGILVAKGHDLKRWISRLTNNNSQKEFYLTDIINMAWCEGRKIHSIQPSKLSEVKGVNNPLQLALLERIYQKEQAELLLLAGVMLSDPARLDLRGKLLHGKDVFIDTNVIIEGRVSLGNRVVIGTGCVLKNTIISDDVIISPYTVIENARLDKKSTVGPFCRIRPGSELGEGAHVGNFVEIKQSRLGTGSKVAHLSYMGDADIGNGVNIGAGTITCNYDGANKHKTIISDDVFIGSGSQIVAPVTIGKGATIGAGTTVTHNVEENEMIISRVRQFPIPNWKRPIKNN